MIHGRLTAFAVAAAATTALAVAPSPASAACANADVKPTTALQQYSAENGVHCLVNEERAARGIAPLTWKSALATAAQRHSKDMVARKFFAHEAPEAGVQDVAYRVQKAGYVLSGDWCVAENISWAPGPQTPRQAVAGWMASTTGHRENILDPDARDFAAGAAVGAPKAGVTLASATYTLVFARTGATSSVSC